ncbi:hypothetical protein ACJRO7_026850, partial [Eucalyptus globulus]
STTATASSSSTSTSNELSEDGVFESRAAIIRDIMGALADNSNRVVGVYGMGGVGKSTLLDDVVSRIREEKQFDLVAKADVSQNPDIKRIQCEIAHALGLDMKDYEYESMRADRLRKRLGNEEKKVLIILDNLWEGLDLKSVGIPCRHDNKVIGCKLLLTSRDRNVLQKQMGCDKDFLLNVLEEKEGKTLFERMVGDKVHDDEFRPLVGEALCKCGSLPLLIVAMAKHLKCAPPHEWRDALYQIEWSTNEDISGVINKVLQLSYDHLKNEDAKSLLQLCVAYGVSKPSIENLVRYGYGWGIFQKDSSIEKARDRLRTLICILQASSLLLDNGGVDGFKIHDLVRDFVARFIFRDRPLLVLKDEDMSATQLLKERLKNCTTICFPYIDMKELPKELDCPELRIFLLFNINESLEVPDSYFNSMRRLAVLNLTSVRLTYSPTPFQFLENLHTLCLQYCLLENVAILGKLKGLQVLSCANSNFQRLPQEIGQLTELRLLDLSRCSHLRMIEPGVLGRLIKLEELYMEKSFHQWNPVEQTQPTNASLIELNQLKNLCTLRVSIPSLSVLPEELDVKKLTKYKIQIGNAMRWSEDQGSKILYLELDPMSDVLRKGCIQSILSKTDDLLLAKLNGSEQGICALSQEGFPKLKHLLVEDSLSIHHILQRRSLSAFEMLESLILKNLVNLMKICSSHIYSSKSFSRLKVIRVESCDKMEVLFPLSLLRGLPQIENIKVVSCKLMRGIVDVDDCGKVDLQNLRVMKLQHLPNIKNFFTTEIAPSSSTSEDQVGTQTAFFNGQQVAFQKLEKLEIIGLDSLEFIFIPSMVKSLTQLKELTISDCEKMEAIVMEEERLGMETSEILAFPMLTDLCLRGLKNLTCFSCGKCAREGRSQDRVKSHATALFNHEIAFQRLEKLEIIGLDSLEFIFIPSVVKSLIQLKELTISDCEKTEAIVMEDEGLGMETSEILVFPKLTDLRLKQLKSLTCFSHGKCAREVRTQDRVMSHVTTLFNHEVAFPNLEDLYIEGMDNIKMIWHDQIPADSFSKLKLLSVNECKKLVNVVPSFTLGRLLSLETLKAKACASLEVIFKLQPLNPLDGNSAACSPLKELKLNDLSKLNCVWDKELYHHIKFQCLRLVTLQGCARLTSLFSTSIARDLIQLGKKCEILTEVISDEDDGEGHVVAFNQLKYMEFDRLTRLRCFSSGGYTLMFPLLEDIIVHRCPHMKFFFEGPIKAPKLERVQVGLNARYKATEYQYFWKGNLNMTIQNMFEEMATSAGSKFMRLFEFPELIVTWHSELNPITSSWQLESLVVDKCPFINAIPSSLMLVLDKLSFLQVYDCELLEEIFDFEGLEAMENTRVLPQLQKLNLANLPKLRRLWNKSLQESLCFNSLGSLILYNCNNLGHAFAPSMARCLANLKNMEIKECGQMEGVIAEEEGQGSAVENITILNLLWMKLECLPNLTCFLLGKNHMLECPKLRTLSIAHCPKMGNLIGQSRMENDYSAPSLFTPQVQCPELRQMVLCHMDNLSKIWSDGPQETLTFDNLQKVQVHNCGSLESVFPHWVATSITQLKELQVESCEIEEIVANGNETLHSNTTRDLFPKLTSLVLHDMPQLKNFCTNLPTLNWPFLKALRVTHCDKANILSFVASMSNWAQKDHQRDLLDQEAHSLFERDFPNLERLLLVDNNIQMIQEGNFPDDMFSKLEALTLACFHDKKAAFPSIFLLERFQNLQSLEVFCSSFEDLFPDEGLVEERKHLVLENLRELKLNKLHNLKCVWREDSLVSKILQ